MKTDEVDYKKLVGQRIRALRQGAHLSQDELSERCGIYRTYLSRIECGSANPTLLVMVALAKALDATINDLVQASDVAPARKNTPRLNT